MVNLFLCQHEPWNACKKQTCPQTSNSGQSEIGDVQGSHSRMGHDIRTCSPPTTIVTTWLEMPTRLSRITLLASSAGVPPCFPSTSGANFSLRWKGNSSSFGSHGFIPICQPMHTYTVTMTTVGTHSSQLTWRHLPMTNLTRAAPTPNTARRRLC